VATRTAVTAHTAIIAAQESTASGTVVRKRTADRDAFRRYVCHTWKRISCQTPVIVGDRKPSGGARGTPSRR
jgi:hypothetical protein